MVFYAFERFEESKVSAINEFLVSRKFSFNKEEDSLHIWVLSSKDSSCGNQVKIRYSPANHDFPLTLEIILNSVGGTAFINLKNPQFCDFMKGLFEITGAEYVCGPIKNKKYYLDEFCK